MNFSFNIRGILSSPSIYSCFSDLIGGKSKPLFVQKYIKPRKGDKVLDIGCGTADILLYLPDVEYTGFDMSQKYIDAARKRYGSKSEFLCENIDGLSNERFSDFDIVIASGIIHHLNDSEAIKLFKLARSALKAGGRIITLDGCYTKDQSRIARFILSNDRGDYVRTEKQYLELASRVFSNVNVNIRSDLLRIPYTHIIMECTS